MKIQTLKLIDDCFENVEILSDIKGFHKLINNRKIICVIENGVQYFINPDYIMYYKL